ncbi:MAG: hypothetical protein AB3N13_13150 [Arenibacterium sp.]
MPESDSDRYVKGAILVAIVLVLASVIAFQKSGYEHVVPVANQYEASTYKQRADFRIENECADFDGAALLECKHDIEQAERDAHRDQKDLKAQRYMALWAFIMAVASLFGLGVTVVGLVFIYRTLKASEKATDAAVQSVAVSREIGEAQVRAYLSVDQATVEADNKGHLVLKVTLKNSGNSPARRVRQTTRVEFRTGVRPEDDVGEFTVENGRTFGLADIAAGGTECFVEPHIGIPAEVSAGEPNILILMEVKVDYSTVFQHLGTQVEVTTLASAFNRLPTEPGKRYSMGRASHNEDQ